MRLSERIYGILLKAYPRRYRERYEALMAQLFADQLRDTNTLARLVRLWFRTLVDLVRTVPVRYFEREHAGIFRLYNRKARICIFFARYAAEGFGHVEITPEDLLLGVLREDRSLGSDAVQEIRRALGGHPTTTRILRGKPLSEDCKRILAAAEQERDQTGAKQILPRHLIAAIVRDKRTAATQLLLQQGIDLDRLRFGQ